jgi:putative membrane protein
MSRFRNPNSVTTPVSVLQAQIEAREHGQTSVPIAVDEETSPLEQSRAFRPNQSPEQVIEVGPEEQIEVVRRLQRLREQVETEQDLGGERAWVSDGRIKAGIWILAAAMILWVFSQAMALVGQIQAMPFPLQYIGWGAFGLVMVMLLAGLLRLTWIYIKLAASPNVSLSAIRELKKREEMRERAKADLRYATKQIQNFLTAYRIEDAKMQRKLRRLGFTGEEVQKLEAVVTKLRRPDRGDDEGYLQNVSEQFLARLDEKAKNRVKAYAILTGAKTAVFSKGHIDALIVAANSYLMVSDLCELYNVRTSRMGTLKVLAHMCIAAFVAANLEDVADSVVDAAKGAFTEDLGPAGAGLVAGATAITKRGTEGLINYLLIQRLGRTTLRNLRPIADH